MLTTLTLAALLATPHPAERDPTTLTVLAEISLERGDCKTAAESYAAAVPGGSVELAKRSSEVALACEHLPAAWDSVQRWRALAPKDLDAASIYATVALKLYRITEAQAAIQTIVASPDSDASIAQLTAMLLSAAEAPAVLAAMSGAVPTDTASPAILTLLGELALSAQDLRRAEEYGQLALKKNPALFATRSLLAQIYAERGDEVNAVAMAQAAAQLDSKNGTFELAEVLTTLERLDKARDELERLRAGGSSSQEIDLRLALLEFQSGNLEEAQRRFAVLGKKGEAGETAQLYLADIASLRGDEEAALAGYQQLVDSSVGLTARTRAAGLLMERGRRTDALQLLDDYVTDHPENSFELTLTKTQLLSEHGETDSSLALLAAVLERYPKHPALEYQRAVLLERDGKVREAVALLERLVAERPADPTLLNALGYTLADHGMRLAHAETVIQRALDITPDNPAVIDSMGWVRFKRGDARGAAQILSRAYALARDSEIAAHWGEALWKIGERKEARKVWAAALEREPDSRALQTVIGRFVPISKP
jgi:Flp pilus assembly protein TadD